MNDEGRMCSIRGRSRPGAFTPIAAHPYILDRQVSGDNTQFKSFLDATHYRLRLHFSETGQWFLSVGCPTSRLHGSRSKTPRLCAWGPASGFRMSGNGNSRARAGGSGLSLGREPMPGVPRRTGQGNRPAASQRCGCPPERSEPVRSDGSGRQCLAMDERYVTSIRARRFCWAAATTNRRVEVVFPQAYGFRAWKVPADDSWMDRSATIGFRCVVDAE